MRIEIGDVVIEGTVEELREMGVKFPFEEGETQIPEAELKVGDYGKIIKAKHGDDLGKIVIIDVIDEDDYGIPYRVSDAVTGENLGWYSRDKIVKATEEEIAQFKAEAEHKREEIRWAKIGRKPGEFKKGDIVRYTPYTGRTCHGLKDYPGIITEVDDVSGGFIYVKKPEFVKSEYGTASDERELELIVPVEQRFDFADAEGARQ
jgi:hypothetical protein